MWTVVLHFGRGNVQTETFDNKADALNCVTIAVFKNEDCVNCSIYKTTDSVVIERSSTIYSRTPSIQETLDSIKWKLDLVEKITSKF